MTARELGTAGPIKVVEYFHDGPMLCLKEVDGEGFVELEFEEVKQLHTVLNNWLWVVVKAQADARERIRPMADATGEP